MLTVLVRHNKSRREVIIPAKTVEYVPQGESESGLIINYGYGEGEQSHFPLTAEGDEDWRDVFVMNEQGQTVARYVL